MDRHADQARQTDEYGNPIRQPGGPNLGGQQETGYGTTGARKTHGGTAPGTFDTGLAGQQQGQLRRSGSSSSSSSEDDGMGGRRKKGLKEKVKEKLPGGHKDDQTCGGAQTTAQGLGGGGYGYGEGQQQQQEKKGMMDKIKDKLPGGGGR